MECTIESIEKEYKEFKENIMKALPDCIWEKSAQIFFYSNIHEYFLYNQDIPENIKSVGYISSTEDLAKLYSACDMYVHLSREDAFGKVIAEALACGTPAIVYDSTACPEVLGEGCGAVVAPGDVMAIYHAMEEIRKDPKEAYVLRCTEHVAANFPKDKLIKDTLNLYQMVMEKKEA